MRRAQLSLSIAVALFTIMVCGCKATETPSNTAAKAPPASVSNANAATGTSNPSAPAGASNGNSASASTPAASDEKPKGPPQLVGTYESREVQSEGVVTVISKLRTIWVFSADGNYTRTSQVNGKTYHSDSGSFRIDAPDKLVLTIQVTGQKADRKIQTPPVVKSHKYSLSPDGEELRLISDKGAVGVFQRVAKPNAS